MAEVRVNHLSEIRYPDGEPLPAPFDVWEYIASEMRKFSCPDAPERPHRWKYTVVVDESDLTPHTEPAEHHGALGTVGRPVVPEKVDRYDEGMEFWHTEWNVFGI